MTTQQAPAPTTEQRSSTGFDFLVGSWDVSHRRFRDSTADEFRGTAAAWTHLGGAVSIEELSVPDRGFAGMALRIYDPQTDAWSVHWISSGSGVIGDPVVGPVGPEGCRLVAVDDFEGAPLHSTYEWFGIERDLVRWRQQLSRDGQAWDLDWEMEFRRTGADPRRQDLSYLPKVTGDFDFLDGTLRLHNRRLKERLTGCDEWIEFEHTSHARTHLGGAVSVDENVMPGFYTGLTFRSYDVVADEWAIHWIDNRTPTLGESVRGRFVDGVGEFYGDDLHEGAPVRVRFVWDSRPAEPTWAQAFSTDGGETWETNWEMTLSRVE